METLNKKATIVFAQLMDKMKEGYLKIVNDPFMPLTMERIGYNIQTPWGAAELYSLCHYYKQNGDLMQAPEMCFVAVDQRGEFKTDYEKIKVVPYMYQQADLGIYEESAIFENSTLAKFRRKVQKDHAMFANLWLGNIQQQGFLVV